MGTKPILRIGSRGSRLALAQARLVRDALIAAHPELAEEGALEIVTVETSGDKRRNVPLYEIGGKGLFTKELEAALVEERIDLAVHSAKDMEAWLPRGLIIACALPREDPRDVLVAPGATSLAELPRGARLGTSSPRRAAQVRMQRPDIAVVPLRGNVETRLKKIERGEADATLLALAGLRRLGLDAGVGTVLSTEAMLPAAGQGVVGIECREADERTRLYLEALNDAKTWTELQCERALLAALGGSCRTPIAALARLGEDERLVLDALIVRPDGSECRRAHKSGGCEDAALIGAAAGLELRQAAGPGFFDEGG